MGHYGEFREEDWGKLVAPTKDKYIPPGLEVKTSSGWVSVADIDRYVVEYAIDGSEWIQSTCRAKFRIMGKEGKTVRVG